VPCSCDRLRFAAGLPLCTGVLELATLLSGCGKHKASAAGTRRRRKSRSSTLHVRLCDTTDGFRRVAGYVTPMCDRRSTAPFILKRLLFFEWQRNIRRQQLTQIDQEPRTKESYDSAGGGELLPRGRSGALQAVAESGRQSASRIRTMPWLRIASAGGRWKQPARINLIYTRCGLRLRDT